MNNVVIAQISDCHLYADKQATHLQANVFNNLLSVLKKINQLAVDSVIFTGDLSQDHSEESYLRFVEAVELSELTIPLYYVAGNHDSPSLMDQLLVHPIINSENVIKQQQWQIALLNSKSDSPAGFVSTEQLIWLQYITTQAKFNLVFMHHHPSDVGYFIDKHGLQNKTEFWQSINSIANVSAIACGHVHHDLLLYPPESTRKLALHCCPATSVQFAQHQNQMLMHSTKGGFKVFTLSNNGSISSQTYYVGSDEH